MPLQNTTVTPEGILLIKEMPKHDITQLQPFNEFRFDDCIAYLAYLYGHPLSIYEAMKLHVMIDVYHVLDRARPVIGGTIYPFTNGPVSRSSKSRVSAWQNRYEKFGQMPEGFEFIDQGAFLKIKPTRMPDADDFSVSEIDAMNLAWRDVVERLEREGFNASQEFFHGKGFIGKAWNKARQSGRNLDWEDIINEYDKENGSDHSRVKSLLRI